MVSAPVCARRTSTGRPAPLPVDILRAYSAKEHCVRSKGIHTVPFFSEIINFCNKNGAYRARTYDPLLVRQMLSQLS